MTTTTLIISLPRALLEQKQIQKEKEEEMLERVKVAMKDGNAKIKERFEELTKELVDGLEREKKLVEGQYVSPYNSTKGKFNFLLCRIIFVNGQSGKTVGQSRLSSCHH